MSLVARKDINPLEGEAPDINDGGAKVTAGEFWPEIRLAEVRLAMRLNGLVSTDRLMHSATESLIHVTEQLADWKAEQVTAGHTSLEVVPSEVVNDTTVLMFRFRRAVYCITKALLTEGYRDIDTTGQGEKHAQALTTQIDTLWRDARWAIRDMQQQSRGLAELV